jgi:hypothetical protein
MIHQTHIRTIKYLQIDQNELDAVYRPKHAKQPEKTHKDGERRRRRNPLKEEINGKERHS